MKKGWRASARHPFSRIVLPEVYLTMQIGRVDRSPLAVVRVT